MWEYRLYSPCTLPARYLTGTANSTPTSLNTPTPGIDRLVARFPGLGAGKDLALCLWHVWQSFRTFFTSDLSFRIQYFSLTAAIVSRIPLWMVSAWMRWTNFLARTDLLGTCTWVLPCRPPRHSRMPSGLGFKLRLSFIASWLASCFALCCALFIYQFSSVSICFALIGSLLGFHQHAHAWMCSVFLSGYMLRTSSKISFGIASYSCLGPPAEQASSRP